MPEEVLWTEGLLSDGRTPQENEGGLENWASMKSGSHGLTGKPGRTMEPCHGLQEANSFAWTHRCSHSLGPWPLVCGSSERLDAGGRLGLLERISGLPVWGPNRCGLKGWPATVDRPKNEGGLENWASMETGSHGLAKKAWADNGALPRFFQESRSFAWTHERCHSLGPLRLV